MRIDGDGRLENVHTLPSQMVNNPVGHVEKITAAAFRPGDDWEKLEKLIDIDGVGQPVASTILHLYDPERLPYLRPPCPLLHSDKEKRCRRR